MPLIQKPGVEDFRDSATVRAVRGAEIVVREGGGAVASGISKMWLGLMLVVFIGTGLGYATQLNSVGSTILYLAVMGLAVAALVWLFRPPTRPADSAFQDGADDPLDGISVPLPAHLRTAAAEEGFHIDYWPRALSEKAGWRAFLGLLFLFLSFGSLMIVGVFLLARGLLLIAPLVGSRVCVQADRRTLTVHSLIGKKTVAWDKIDEVALQTFDRRNYWVVFSTGTRHNLVVRGQHDFEYVELLIPYPLLGLDRVGAKRLARRIMDARGQASEAPVAAAMRQPVASVPPSASRPTLQPAAEDASEALEGFDPDRIMARYLGEREATLRASQMPPIHRSASFGRKRVM